MAQALGSNTVGRKTPADPLHLLIISGKGGGNKAIVLDTETVTRALLDN